MQFEAGMMWNPLDFQSFGGFQLKPKHLPVTAAATAAIALAYHIRSLARQLSAHSASRVRLQATGLRI
jgi:hypothetical protein